MERQKTSQAQQSERRYAGQDADGGKHVHRLATEATYHHR